MNQNKQQAFLPLDVAYKYFKRWDCETQTKTNNNLYFKCMEGLGQIQFLNGNVYNGEIQNGLLHGKGTFKWTNGLIYTGQFQKNNITGNGKYTWQDGSWYSGQVLNGKKHGTGQYYSMKDKATYSGQWLNGKKDGKGKIVYQNSALYEGFFKDGKRQGFGKMHYSSGNEYQGEWKNDKKNGKGSMNWFDTHQRYTGQWINDQPSGVGDYYWFDCKVEYKTIKNIYKGQWSKGKRQGLGAFFYANGCKFEGQFKQNLKENFGLLMDEYGQIKTQYFKQDKSVTNLQKKKKFLTEKSVHNSNNGVKLPQLVNPMHKGKPLQKLAQNLQSITNSSQQQNVQQSLTAESEFINQYKKYIDFEDHSINEQLHNFLLKNNSKLKNWYKSIGIGSSNTKDFYTGMTLENFWKFLKDLRYTSQFISLAKIDRQFFKGFKSSYDIQKPCQQKLRLAELYKDKNLSEIYSEIEWYHLFYKIKQATVDEEKYLIQQIPKKLISQTLAIHDVNKNIHVPKNIILQRHFVCLLLHLAIQQRNSQCNKDPNGLRKNLQIIFSELTNIIEHNQPDKQHSSDNITHVSANSLKNVVSEWAIKMNEQLLQTINKKRKQFNKHRDLTVSVRTLYSILINNNMLKDSTQKMLFLEKIERGIGSAKLGMFKKDMKHHYGELEKLVLQSPYFSYLMNYEMVSKQYQQILFQTINRKIYAKSQQQAQNHYKQQIELLKEYVERAINCQTVPKIQIKRGSSKKDQAKKILLQKAQQQKQRILQEKRKNEEKTRQLQQCRMMTREDVNIQVLEEAQLSQEYFD